MAVPSNHDFSTMRYLDIRGRLPAFLDSANPERGEYFYPSARIYSQVWEWVHRDEDPFTAAYFPERNGEKSNHLCFQAFQMMKNPNGKF